MHRPTRFLASLAPPLIAVAFCLAASLLALSAFGYRTEPGQGFASALSGMAHIVWQKAVLPGNHYRGWIKSGLAATPLLLTGLAVTVAFRAGVLNIGGEGQFLAGAVAATAVGLFWHAPAPLLLAGLLLAGAAAGAALAAIASVLERWRNVPIVLSTLLLNFVAMEVLRTVLQGPLRGSDGQPASDELPVAAQLPQWVPSGGRVGLHLGCAVALVAALLIAFILRRTIFGFRLRVVGENPTAARFAGIRVGTVAFASLALSGALAGLAGGIQISGVESYQLLLSMSNSGLGFAGIAVALLGRLTVSGVIAAAIFFGVLNTAFGALQSEANVPSVAGFATQGGILIAMLVLTQVRKR
jgi:simple sugar transport system permease protein